MTSASTRGSTSTLAGSSPMTRSASISSRICMEPSSAVIALPERPATMIAVRSGASSRSVRMPTRSTVKTLAPKKRSWKAPCCATMQPIRNDITHDDRNGAHAGQLDLARHRHDAEGDRMRERRGRTRAPCRRACEQTISPSLGDRENGRADILQHAAALPPHRRLGAGEHGAHARRGAARASGRRRARRRGRRRRRSRARAWRAGRRRRCRARRPPRDRDELLAARPRAAPEDSCRSLVEPARLLDDPAAAGKEKQAARLEMMLKRCGHERRSAARLDRIAPPPC